MERVIFGSVSAAEAALGDGNGNGNGDGDGDGYGDGDGNGNGNGYGYGNGDGNGYGNGYGNGNGYGYGNGDGYGYGNGDGNGYGNGYGNGNGNGNGNGYGMDKAYLQAYLAAAGGVRASQLRAAGAVVAFWRSRKDGTPANGGTMPPVKVGDVQEIPGPLKLCGPGALHATDTPTQWNGERWWLVALHHPVIQDGDKYGSLKREILEDLGECPYPARG